MAKVTKVEIKTASNGNPYKQVSVDTGIGDKDRFNIFADHPKYDACVVGTEVPQDHLFINQRGYLELKNESAKAGKAQLAEMAIKDHIDRKIESLKKDLKVIADHLGVEAPKETIGNTGVEYPESETSDGSGELTSSDVPFN